MLNSIIFRSRAPALPNEIATVVETQVPLEFLEVIREEVSVNHQRVENDMVFEDEAKKNPRLFENLMWEYISKAGFDYYSSFY